MGRLYAGNNPEPFRIGVHYDTLWPPTPEEFTIGMKIKVDRLKLELLLSQPSPLAQPSQQPCSVSRMTTDTSKMERGRLFVCRRYEKLEVERSFFFSCKFWDNTQEKNFTSHRSPGAAGDRSDTECRTPSNSIPVDDGASERTPNSGCNVILFLTGGIFVCLFFLSYSSVVC